MIVFVNENNEIKDVDITKDATLTALPINDDDMNPFATWSVAKICCYRVEVQNGAVTMYTPYIDSRIIDHIDQLGTQNETNSSEIVDTQLGLVDTFEAMAANTESITMCEEALAEIYEMILGG